MSSSAASDPSAKPHRSRRWGAEILALTSLAIAQPLFAVLARGADFFVAHDSRPGDLMLFAAVVYLGPPLALWTIVRGAAVVGRKQRAARAAQAVVLTVLAALLVAPWLDRAGAGTIITLFAALLAGAGFAAVTDRLPLVRSFLSLLAPLTIAVPLLFLLLPPVSALVRPASIDSLSAEVTEPTPLVIVIFDELPIVSLLDAKREIDAEMFPNFAALAAQSHWFTNTTSISPSTNEAVPAILTGRYPAGEETAIASEHPRSLFTLLGEQYEHRVEETQTRLCPKQLCPPDDTIPRAVRLARLLLDASVVELHIVAPTGFRHRLPPISATWKDFLTLDRPASPAPDGEASEDVSIIPRDLHIYASDRTRVFEEFLARLTPPEDGRPTHDFLHVMLPHVPWVYLPSGKEYWGSLYSSALAHGVGPDTAWTTEEWLVVQGYQRHMLQLVYVDRLMGRLMERLDATGLADEAILVVTADHGLSFVPGLPGRKPSPETFADIMAVPLFLRTPGQTEAVVDERNVEIVDILPTLADLLGMELPFTVDGRALLEKGSLDNGPLEHGSQRPAKVLFYGDERHTYRPEALDARFDSLERKLEIFDRGLFGIGPRPEILDRPVNDLPVGEPAAVQVRLDQAEQYRRVDLDGRYLPAQVFGRMRAPGGPSGDEEPLGVEVAIAVNGVVRAVTRTFADNGTRFVAMVPEESFVDGANRVDIYTVEGNPGDAVLRPTTRHEAPVYSLGRDTAGRVVRLEASDGSTCRLDPDAVEGSSYQFGTGFGGWARDPSGERPYIVIMTFADDRLVHTVTTGVEPPAESEVAGRPGYEESGFRFVLPASVIDASAEIRLFAVIGDRGTELPRVEGDDLCLYCGHGQ